MDARVAHRAQDLVQEAFIRLHAQTKVIERPKPWLYRTVHNLAISHHRERSKIVPLAKKDAQGEESAVVRKMDLVKMEMRRILGLGS